MIILSSNDNLLDAENKDIIYYWNGFKDSKYYINSLIDKDKDQFRETYLHFIESINKIDTNSEIFRKIFKIDNFHNLWEMSSIYEKCPNKSLVINDCIKLIAFEKVLEIEKPHVVKLISKDINLYRSLKILCTRNKIKLDSEIKLLDIIRYNIVLFKPNALKTIYFIFKKFIACFYVKRFDANYKLKHEISIISYFLNYKIEKNKSINFFSNYWHNLPELINQYHKDINWIHLGIDSNGIKNFNNFKKNNKNLDGEKINHMLVDNHLSMSIFFLSLFSFLNISFKSIFIFNIKKFFNLNKSNINFYSFLKNEWITSTRGVQLFHSIITVKVFDKLFSSLPKQKIGLYLYENQSWERALIGSWRKYNHGKLVGVDHTTGYMRYWDLRYYKSLQFFNNLNNKQSIPDLHCVNSPISKKLLIQSGFPENKIIDVEALRFNSLLNYDVIPNIDRSKNSKVLLIGDIDYNSTKNLLSDIKKISDVIKDKFEFSFRPHPGTMNIEKLISFAKNMQINISSSDLITDISIHNKVIIVDSSSVSIESYLMNKKTIVYLGFKKLNLNPINILKDIDFVSNSEDLLQALSKDITDNDYKKEFFWLSKNLKKWKIFFDKLFLQNNLKH